MMYDPYELIARALMLTRPGAADGGQMVTTQGQEQVQPQPQAQVQAQPQAQQQASPSANMYEALMQHLSQAPSYHAAQPTDFPSPRYEPVSRSGEIANIYQQLFNRAPDVEGMKYWMDTGRSGRDLARDILSGAQGSDRDYYSQNFSGFERLTPQQNVTGRSTVYGPDGRAYSSPSDAMMAGIFNYSAQPIRPQYRFDPATDPSRVINATLAARRAAEAAANAPGQINQGGGQGWEADQQARDAVNSGGGGG